EKTAGFAVIIVRPQMDLILDPNQLRADASDTALSPDAALQDVVDSQFAPDLRDRLIGVFISGGRRSRDHAEPFWVEFAQICNGLFRQTIAEVLLLRVIAQVGEG